MADKRGAKTARLDVGDWWNEASGYIHIAAKDAFISTVSNDPKSKRYHPNLYKKLSKALADAGVPHPNPSPKGEGLKS